MKLADAASFFDLTPAYDTVSGKVLFKGQIDPFDDSRRDSPAAYRRILSVRPGTVMPASGVIRMMGPVWLLGVMEPDGLQELHREKRPIQQAPNLMKISRLSGYLAGTIASTQYTSTAWLKDLKQIDTSSDLPQLYELMFAASADVRLQDVIWSASTAYLVLAVRMEASGFLGATCLELDQALPLVGQLAARTYDPVAGGYTTGGSASVNVLKVRWQDLFYYASQASAKFQPGDISFVLPANTTCSTSSLLTYAGVTYQTLAVLDIAGSVVLHARVI